MVDEGHFCHIYSPILFILRFADARQMQMTNMNKISSMVDSDVRKKETKDNKHISNNGQEITSGQKSCGEKETNAASLGLV